MKNKKKRSLLSKIFVEFLFKEIIIIIAISLILGLIAWIISVLDFNWMYKVSHQTYSEAINLFDFVFTGITPFLIIFLIIFRYPGNKTEITGVTEEVWHYRYVGIETATEIYKESICLEEYLEIKNNLNC